MMRFSFRLLFILVTIIVLGPFFSSVKAQNDQSPISVPVFPGAEKFPPVPRAKEAITSQDPRALNWSHIMYIDGNKIEEAEEFYFNWLNQQEKNGMLKNVKKTESQNELCEEGRNIYHRIESGGNFQPSFGVGDLEVKLIYYKELLCGTRYRVCANPPKQMEGIPTANKSCEPGYTDITGKTYIRVSYTLIPSNNFNPQQGLSPAPSITLNPAICTVPPDIEQKRQELLKEISSKYDFSVADTNICGKYPECGNNQPWSVNDLNIIKDTLGKLPRCFIDKVNLKQISGIQFDAGGGEGENIERQACCSDKARVNCTYSAHIGVFDYHKIVMCDEQLKTCGDPQDTFLGTFVHELTHAYQYYGTGYLTSSEPIYDTPIIKSWMESTGWGFCLPIFGCFFGNDPPADVPTRYAKLTKNPLEDMADSVMMYYENPISLKIISPRRYNFVRDNIMCGKEY